MNDTSERHRQSDPSGLIPLPQSFYEPTADIVAPKLVGHCLLRRTAGGIEGGLIVETEAYISNDPACHGYIGPTNRNRAMFGPPGFAYVYLIYGFYFCLNAVCAQRDQGEAVLIRAIEPLWGLDQMRRRRKTEKVSDLTTGPGKLCMALEITKSEDGVAFFEPAGELLICANFDRDRWLRSQGGLYRTTRIGLTKAADWPLRFYARDNLFVSKREKLPKTAGTEKARNSRK